MAQGATEYAGSDAAEAVLAFWIGEAATATEAAELKRWVERWFTRDAALDAEIGTVFGDLVVAARRGDLDAWAASPRGRLALLVLLDQFPRNLYRGSGDAFRADPKALALAKTTVDDGGDRALSPVERLFVYLPFEHSEDIADQERAVGLLDALRAEAPPGLAGAFSGFHDYAIKHRDVIARFGRFPHRNAVLGRETTPAEADYLAQPGSGF